MYATMHKIAGNGRPAVANEMGAVHCLPARRPSCRSRT